MYWLLIIVTLLLGLGAQGLIRHTYNRWSQVPISNRITGAQAARKMLDANGLTDVRIDCIPGNLTDNFDPRDRVLHLSQQVHDGFSVSSTAVACHEAGHAVQHALNYGPARFRMALVPAVQFASNAWMFILLIGIFLNFMGLVYVGIALYAIAVLFQVVTLPVEFDASHRALATVGAQGLPAEEVGGARSVLTAAAFTYVAAALASLLQLLYFIGMARD